MVYSDTLVLKMTRHKVIYHQIIYMKRLHGIEVILVWVSNKNSVKQLKGVNSMSKTKNSAKVLPFKKRESDIIEMDMDIFPTIVIPEGTVIEWDDDKI